MQFEKLRRNSDVQIFSLSTSSLIVNQDAKKQCIPGQQKEESGNFELFTLWLDYFIVKSPLVFYIQANGEKQKSIAVEIFVSVAEYLA